MIKRNKFNLDSLTHVYDSTMKILLDNLGLSDEQAIERFGTNDPKELDKRLKEIEEWLDKNKDLTSMKKEAGLRNSSDPYDQILDMYGHKAGKMLPLWDKEFGIKLLKEFNKARELMESQGLRQEPIKYIWERLNNDDAYYNKLVDGYSLPEKGVSVETKTYKGKFQYPNLSKSLIPHLGSKRRFTMFDGWYEDFKNLYGESLDDDKLWNELCDELKEGLNQIWNKLFGFGIDRILGRLPTVMFKNDQYAGPVYIIKAKQGLSNEGNEKLDKINEMLIQKEAPLRIYTKNTTKVKSVEGNNNRIWLKPAMLEDFYGSNDIIFLELLLGSDPMTDHTFDLLDQMVIDIEKESKK